MRLNYLRGVEGANEGTVDWDGYLDASKAELYHGPDNPGILIIAHGDIAPEWNWAVKLAMDDLKNRYPMLNDIPVELSFLEDELVEEDPRNAELELTGMSINDAVDRLRDQGVEWLGVIPLMINNCSSHIEEIRWLVGYPVEKLTSNWTGNISDDNKTNMASFEGFIAHRKDELVGAIRNISCFFF